MCAKISGTLGGSKLDWTEGNGSVWSDTRSSKKNWTKNLGETKNILVNPRFVEKKSKINKGVPKKNLGSQNLVESPK